MGQRGRLLESRGKPEYVDFIQVTFSFGRIVVSYCSIFLPKSVLIKRTDLLAVLQHLNLTHMQPKFTQKGRTCFTFRELQAIC